MKVRCKDGVPANREWRNRFKDAKIEDFLLEEGQVLQPIAGFDGQQDKQPFGNLTNGCAPNRDLSLFNSLYNGSHLIPSPSVPGGSVRNEDGEQCQRSAACPGTSSK